jgi:hypothetical protein
LVEPRQLARAGTPAKAAARWARPPRERRPDDRSSMCEKLDSLARFRRCDCTTKRSQLGRTHVCLSKPENRQRMTSRRYRTQKVAGSSPASSISRKSFISAAPPARAFAQVAPRSSYALLNSRSPLRNRDDRRLATRADVRHSEHGATKPAWLGGIAVRARRRSTRFDGGLLTRR